MIRITWPVDDDNVNQISALFDLTFFSCSIRKCSFTADLTTMNCTSGLFYVSAWRTDHRQWKTRPAGVTPASRSYDAGEYTTQALYTDRTEKDRWEREKGPQRQTTEAETTHSCMALLTNCTYISGVLYATSVWPLVGTHRRHNPPPVLWCYCTNSYCRCQGDGGRLMRNSWLIHSIR